jgi:hypothetical protein
MVLISFRAGYLKNMKQSDVLIDDPSQFRTFGRREPGRR